MVLWLFEYTRKLDYTWNHRKLDYTLRLDKHNHYMVDRSFFHSHLIPQYIHISSTLFPHQILYKKVNVFMAYKKMSLKRLDPDEDGYIHKDEQTTNRRIENGKTPEKKMSFVGRWYSCTNSIKKLKLRLYCEYYDLFINMTYLRYFLPIFFTISYDYVFIVYVCSRHVRKFAFGERSKNTG